MRNVRILEGTNNQIFWLSKSKGDGQEVKLHLTYMDAGFSQPAKIELPKESMVYQEYTRGEDKDHFVIFPVVPTLIKVSAAISLLVYNHT